MKTKLAACLIAASVATALGGTATANHVDRSAKANDPKDSDGRLDIVKVRYYGHRNDTATLVIRTEDKWPCNFLRGVAEAPHTYAAGLSWNINKNKNPANEKSGHFTCQNNKLFFRVNNGSAIRAQRPDRHTAKVRIPLRQTKHLSLVAISRITGEVDGHVFVDEEDVAPEGRLEP